MLPSGACRTSAWLSAMLTGRTRRALGVPVLMSGAARLGGAALVESAERGALAREPFEQWGRGPARAVLAVERRHPLVHRVQAHRVGVEHRSAAEAGEAVAGEVDDVDVGGAQRVALVEDL